MLRFLYIIYLFQYVTAVRLFSSSIKSKINLEFFHGSNIGSSFYEPFIEQLQNTVNKPKNLLRMNVSTPNYITWPFFPKNTVLIGHSFGGSICLWYCMLEKLLGVSNIKACVLINCHFNQRNVMPYPKINMLSIKVPVLTILTNQDEKLPIFKAIDDAIFVKENNITNKMFVVIEGNHTSCFIESYEMNSTVGHIKNFLFSLK